MEFKLKIDLSNGAFEWNTECQVVDILSSVSCDIIDGLTSGIIRDVNGNKVGQWSFD